MNRFPLPVLIRGLNNVFRSSTTLAKEIEGASEPEISKVHPPSSSSSTVASDLEDHGTPLAIEELEDQEDRLGDQDDLDHEPTGCRDDGVQRLQSVCLPTVFLPSEMQEAMDSVLTGNLINCVGHYRSFLSLP